MNLTKDELIIANQDMVNTLGTNILYKYRSDNEHTENIIKNSALWFSRPREFNDPFDCYSVLEKFSKQDVEEWRENNNSYKKASLKDKIIANKHTNKLTYKKVKSIIDSVLNKIDICCFNKTEKEVLMWSHYSDKHKGMCMEFNIEYDPSFFIFPYTVKYKSSIQPFNYFKNNKTEEINELIKDIIITKNDKWSYEQEVRVIKYSEMINFSDLENGKEVKFAPKALRKIIFGCKASEETISKYKDLCTKNGFNHVTFSKMQQKMDGTYELEETSLY